jgi:hypothetical protein
LLIADCWLLIADCWLVTCWKLALLLSITRAWSRWLSWRSPWASRSQSTDG